MRRIFTLFVLVVVALVFTAPVEAQFARANVQGDASDPDGLPLPGVTVTLRNEATGATRTVVTSASGGYVVQGLVPGTYTILFTLQGFQTVQQTGLELHVGQSPSVNVTMTLSTLEETITVTALTPMIEVTSKEVGGSLTAREIEDLPSINRSFILFSSLLPGVVARQGTGTLSADTIFVNGQDDNNTQFNIDGAPNDDDQNGGNAGGQVRAAFEAMAEFQILTSQFDAEFGRSMGGVVNAVTKSGTNEFHGVGFYYAQRSNWNTTPFFTERANIVQPRVSFNGEGVTGGGPIIRDRTHFFVSFEHLAPNRPIVNNFDSIGRPEETFSVSSENNVWNWVLKLDHQVSDNNKFTARLLWEYQPQRNATCSSCIASGLGAEEDYDWTFVTSFDSVLSDTMFNNFRWSFVREDLDFADARVFDECDRSSGRATFDCVSSFEPALAYRNIRDGQRGRQGRRRNNSINFDDTLSWYLPDHKGDHDLRMGFTFQMKEVDHDRSGGANGRFRFETNDVYDFNDTSTYPDRFDVFLGGPLGTGRGDLPQVYVAGLFFQDDWQPIPNFTVNLGVRWDWETITQGDYNNIAPRVGFAWDPAGDGLTTVRAGVGRFYSRYVSGEWDDPIFDGVFRTSAIRRNYNDGRRDQADMILQMQLSGCPPDADLSCLRNWLRDILLADIDNLGFNSSPTIDGAPIGLRDQPYADTISFGVEREMMDNLSLGVDVVRTETKNSIIRARLNMRSRELGRPNISIFNGEVNTNFNDIDVDMNRGIDARTTHTSLLVSLRKRMSDTVIGRLAGRLSYTLSKSSGNTDNRAFAQESRFQVFSVTGYNFDTGEITGVTPTTSILGLNDPRGSGYPVSFSRKHNFVVSGSWIIPRTSFRENGGIVLSGIFRTITGSHSTMGGSDINDNGFRNPAPAGTYSANEPNDISFSDIDFAGTRFGMTNPTQVTLDFSVRYRIPFGSRGWYATLSLDAFNLLNRVNFEEFASLRPSSSSFLIPDEAFPMREIQLGVKFTY